MRGIIFAVLTLIVGGLIALGLEWLAAFICSVCAPSASH